MYLYQSHRKGKRPLPSTSQRNCFSGSYRGCTNPAYRHVPPCSSRTSPGCCVSITYSLTFIHGCRRPKGALCNPCDCLHCPTATPLNCVNTFHSVWYLSTCLEALKWNKLWGFYWVGTPEADVQLVLLIAFIAKMISVFEQCRHNIDPYYHPVIHTRLSKLPAVLSSLFIIAQAVN